MLLPADRALSPLDAPGCSGQRAPSFRGQPLRRAGPRARRAEKPGAIISGAGVMGALGLSLAWCGVQFVVFLLVCRLSTVRRERTALLCHVVSFALFFALVVALFLRGSVPATIAAG